MSDEEFNKLPGHEQAFCESIAKLLCGIKPPQPKKRGLP
jgi:hypothetical protein